VQLSFDSLNPLFIASAKGIDADSASEVDVFLAVIIKDLSTLAFHRNKR